MITKIQKWGNSLGLRIPKSFADEAAVRPGSPVDLSIVDGRLVVRALRSKKHRLCNLLRRVNAKNLHRELSTAGPVGRESW